MGAGQNRIDHLQGTSSPAGLALFSPGALPGRGWLVIFTDLIALLLTFFVMLFAMQEVDGARWQPIDESLSRNFAPTLADPDRRAGADASIQPLLTLPADDLDYLRALLLSRQADDPVLGKARFTGDGDGLLISLPADLLFASGRADLAEKGEKAVATLGRLLANIGNGIEVQGHADDRKLAAGSGFASNWELSLQRALAVADGLRGAGYGRDIAVFGFGDGHFRRHLAAGPEGGDLTRQRALARRVDIMILGQGEKK